MTHVVPAIPLDGSWASCLCLPVGESLGDGAAEAVDCCASPKGRQGKVEFG